MSADQALLSSQENRRLVLANCLKNAGTLAVERQDKHPQAPIGVRHSLAFGRGWCWGPAGFRDLPQLTSG